jgi:hypothetical protein
MKVEIYFVDFSSTLASKEVIHCQRYYPDKKGGSMEET